MRVKVENEIKKFTDATQPVSAGGVIGRGVKVRVNVRFTYTLQFSIIITS